MFKDVNQQFLFVFILNKIKNDIKNVVYTYA